MVHTLPPWSTNHKMIKVFSNVDNAELAARLGSIVTYDRRGNVVFIEDFEGSGLFWETNLQGANAAAQITTDWAKNGSQSCELKAGDGAAGCASISRDFFIPVVGNVGLESSFTIDLATDYVDFFFYYYYSTGYLKGQLRYNCSTDLFYYRDVHNNLIALDLDFWLTALHKPFNTWKIVMDLENNEYVRVLINGEEIEMNVAADTDNWGGGFHHLYGKVTHWSANAAAKSIYVDNIILTINEP